jgi:hypothetical protein
MNTKLHVAVCILTAAFVFATRKYPYLFSSVSALFTARIVVCALQLIKSRKLAFELKQNEKKKFDDMVREYNVKLKSARDALFAVTRVAYPYNTHQSWSTVDDFVCPQYQFAANETILADHDPDPCRIYTPVHLPRAGSRNLFTTIKCLTNGCISCLAKYYPYKTDKKIIHPVIGRAVVDKTDEWVIHN